VGSEDFEIVKEWVKNMARNLKIDQGYVQIGVVSDNAIYFNCGHKIFETHF